ncbi:MAG: UDP-N-acetylmuramate--L-alanine ligase [Acidobacteria bacterium]|nr:UDP-N-acetylmuramate--L-alanine ligase [Acidobacteriota bacterium]MCH8971308.1 UDP-N-acetylmuramate--L-alanine ligase [Acidobacteriota bacterium]TDI50369.1 MAG: UDP-N-acetylmuramate--L-alanine ligase [Acidobacteriota bacterium]TDI55479.1 MAG: UDP-N-acetylmuramate--L-alanine ligase [Acidobacteriota bacterium]
MRLPYKRIHIVGAGGTGMSAIAKVLVAQGYEVSGSDLRGGATLESLADIGVAVFTGHHPEVAVSADLVVASSAVPEYDQELAAAHDEGIPTWRRPQFLEALTSDISTIGATGTHGKTTTTALMITALQSTGLDPSFVMGGELSHLGTNGHVGTSDLLVLEADEAFRTFENLHLDGLVVTNVEAEHLEHFGTEQDLIDSFVSVAESVSGPVVACVDDRGAAEVASRARTLTYGQSPAAAWRIEGLERKGPGSTFQLVGPTGSVNVELQQPGRHFALNATGVLALLAELGHDLDAIARGLSAFRGVDRRWEHRGTVGGVVLYDDYAHHPTEVRATLEAASGVAQGRLWAVFQPHLYSRTERLSDEFGAALSSADVVVVTDVYGAREEPVPGVTGELVADAARAAGAEVYYVPHRADLVEFLLPKVDSGDLVLTMGAGDITLLHTEFASRLGALT